MEIYHWKENMTFSEMYSVLPELGFLSAVKSDKKTEIRKIRTRYGAA